MIWNPMDWIWQLFQAGKLTEQPDEDPPEDKKDRAEPGAVDEVVEPEDEQTAPIDVPATPLVSKVSVGAWTGSGSITNTDDMARDVAFAKWLGLTRLDVMVNDHSAKRQPRDFDTYNKGRVAAFCKRAVAEGIEIHLTTWCMPHERYIQQLGVQMTDLVGECGARSICLDAEEPWVNAVRPMSWEAAASLMDDVLDAPFGVSGIGYASKTKLGPLVRRAQYMVPQCYSTSGNSLDPKKAAVQLSNLWRSRFGNRPLVVGLAGYKQDGRPGYTKAQFMKAAFDTARRADPISIVYWSLRHIRASRTTANLIREFTRSLP